MKIHNQALGTFHGLTDEIFMEIKTRALLGKVYGSIDPDGSDFSLSKACFMVENIYRNATSIYGDLNIINNKYGKMVMELLNTGLDIGIISRTVHNSKLIKIYGWDLTTNLRVTDTIH